MCLMLMKIQNRSYRVDSRSISASLSFAFSHCFLIFVLLSILASFYPFPRSLLPPFLIFYLSHSPRPSLRSPRSPVSVVSSLPALFSFLSLFTFYSHSQPKFGNSGSPQPIKHPLGIRDSILPSRWKNVPSHTFFTA